MTPHFIQNKIESPCNGLPDPVWFSLPLLPYPYFLPLLLLSFTLTSPSHPRGPWASIRPGTPLPQAFSVATPSSRNVLPSYLPLLVSSPFQSPFKSLFLSAANSDPSYLNFSAPYLLLLSHSLFYRCSTALITKDIIYYFLRLLSRLHCQNLALCEGGFVFMY